MRGGSVNYGGMDDGYVPDYHTGRRISATQYQQQQYEQVHNCLFCSFFFVFSQFWRRSYKNMKILNNLCLHFARQDGQDGNLKLRKSRN